MSSTDETGLVLRPYAGAVDRVALDRCFIELQQVERSIEPTLLRDPMLAVGPYVDDLLELWAADQAQVLLAELDGEVVGYVSVTYSTDPPSPDDEPVVAAVLQDIVVLPAGRGRGVGERLVVAAEDLARGRGCAELRITMLANNRGARRFYERCGYRDVLVEVRKLL
jgi:ribosomal protein S18 acetylase RimI-like enzyme